MAQPNVQTKAAPAGGHQQTQQSVAFPLAARKMSRYAFDTGIVNLQTAAVAVQSPIQLDAMGYLDHLDLYVTLSLTSSAAAVYTADAPFSVFTQIGFQNASGNDIITPLSGYNLYLSNKWGCQFAQAPYSDPRNPATGYSVPAITAAGTTTVTCRLSIPLGVDPATGFSAVPNLASNAAYKVQMTLAALSAIATNLTAGTIRVQGIAHYWSLPPATNSAQQRQATEPIGNGSLSQWQYESFSLGSGGSLKFKSVNVGYIDRTVIFVGRNNTGARDDSIWPALTQITVDNNNMFYEMQNQWKAEMAEKFGLSSATQDVFGGLDTGVYVLPFHALASSIAGNVANSRSQLLPTQNTTQLQIEGTSFGANSGILEILTNSIATNNIQALYAR